MADVLDFPFIKDILLLHVNECTKYRGRKHYAGNMRVQCGILLVVGPLMSPHG